MKIHHIAICLQNLERSVLFYTTHFGFKEIQRFTKSGWDGQAVVLKSDTIELEIFSFSKVFLKSKYYRPIIVVPSTYSKTLEKDLIKNGIKIVIYANHLLRASYPAMIAAAKSILVNQRAINIEKKITPIGQILDLIK